MFEQSALLSAGSSLIMKRHGRRSLLEVIITTEPSNSESGHVYVARAHSGLEILGSYLR